MKASGIRGVLAFVVLASACSGGDDAVISRGGSGGPPASPFKTFKVCDGPGTVQTEALRAFFEAREGDTIEFCAGTFEFTTGLIAHGRRGLTIKGAGRDKTILDFADSGSSEGLNVSHTDGVVIQGLTVRDTPGNAVRVFRSKYVTIRDVRVEWSDYATCSTDPTAENTCARHGAYGLYPVECDHVLIEDSESFGASDAGIYVGQSSDIIVRRTRAEYNVAGFEFENTYRALFEDNIATNNTAGFLVFDLPGLRQYGQKNIVRRNHSFNNNIDNFAPIGNIVGLAPRGTGMLLLATDLLEIYDNVIENHDTIGIAIVNFGLADGHQNDKKYDFYPEGVYIHDNTFRDNGGNPQEPNLERDVATALPLVIVLKNKGKSAHIAWDGARDLPNECTRANGKEATDKRGTPLRLPSTAPEPERAEPRVDARGRPNYIRSDIAPDCDTNDIGVTMRTNEWKFVNAEGDQQPENWLYIKDNVFENNTPQTLLVDPFVNFNLTTSDSNFYGFDPTAPDPAALPNATPPPILLDLVTPASNDLSVHGGTVPGLLTIAVPVLQLPFVPSASGDVRPDPAAVAQVCGRSLAAGEINRQALEQYNCPQLHQYGLFSDPADPRSTPNGGGVPFDLNSALFSDYATKYRVLFLPDGQKATYRDAASGVTASLQFPVGTVLAKTFTFRTEDAAGALISEDVVETRLLIKRQNGAGTTWVGLPYIWNKSPSGALTTADLHVEGGEASVSFDYQDPDPDVVDDSSPPKRVRYSGSTQHYAIPAALNCITCHGGDDREPGAAPLGLKPRYLNRDYDYGGSTGTMNQLQYLTASGRLDGLPADLAAVEKHPRWNVPGDRRVTGGAESLPTPNSPQDIHGRMRAYLEVNCMHCHAGDGAASNSNLFLDSFRTVNSSYGICKKPVAAGKGTCEGCLYDIVPKADTGADESILFFRISSTVAGIRMPPLARTIVHGEAANLTATWIETVLPALADEIEDEETCTGGGTGVPALPGPLTGLLPAP